MAPALLAVVLSATVQAQAPAPAADAGTAEAVPPPQDEGPALKLGAGDGVNIKVFGRPELTTSTYVADDGTITMPLVGAVAVGGLSPEVAARRVEDALRDGQFLVNPQVTITVSQYRSQQVSVLGEVHNPGRYPMESRTNVLDMLARAGGVNELGADTIYLLRADKTGQIKRYAIDLRGLSDPSKPIPDLVLQAGDSIYVPKADQFYIYGEVNSPNMYRLEPGMTVVEAITRGGGLTPRGSDSRITIRRRAPNGKFVTVDAALGDAVRPNDVIRVKERLF